MANGAATRRMVLAGSVLLPASFVSGQPSPVISARAAFEAARANRIVLIDIRSPAERADTGLPAGAVPLDADGPAFEPRLAGLRLDHPGRPLALIDRAGGRAAELRRRLAGRGWRDLVTVRGGMLGPGGWLADKLPVTRR